MENAWESDYKLFNAVTYPYLNTKGSIIGELTQKGDKTAITIYKLYESLYRSFDPVTHLLLRIEIMRFIIGEAIKNYSPKEWVKDKTLYAFQSATDPMQISINNGCFNGAYNEKGFVMVSVALHLTDRREWVNSLMKFVKVF